MRIFLFIIVSLCVHVLFSAERIIDVYIIGGQSNATGQARMKNIPHTFLC